MKSTVSILMMTLATAAVLTTTQANAAGRCKFEAVSFTDRLRVVGTGRALKMARACGRAQSKCERRLAFQWRKGKMFDARCRRAAY